MTSAVLQQTVTTLTRLVQQNSRRAMTASNVCTTLASFISLCVSNQFQTHCCSSNFFWGCTFGLSPCSGPACWLHHRATPDSTPTSTTAEINTQNFTLPYTQFLGNTETNLRSCHKVVPVAGASIQIGNLTAHSSSS